MYGIVLLRYDLIAVIMTSRPDDGHRSVAADNYFRPSRYSAIPYIRTSWRTEQLLRWWSVRQQKAPQLNETGPKGCPATVIQPVSLARGPSRISCTMSRLATISLWIFIWR